MWQAMRGYSFDNLHSAVQDIVYQGFPMATILSQLFDEVISKTDISDLNKALIAEKLATAEMNLNAGSSEYLQLLDVSSFIMRRMTDTGANVDTRSASNH